MTDIRDSAKILPQRGYVEPLKTMERELAMKTIEKRKKTKAAADKARLRKVVAKIRARHPDLGMPEKVTTMRRFLHEAWDLVHRLMSAGLKFPGTPSEAALVIAGNAYGAWRGAEVRMAAGEDGVTPATEAVAGMVQGIDLATVLPHGVIARNTFDFAFVTSTSTDLIDSVVPMKLLAALWPDEFSESEILLKTPTYGEAGTYSSAGDSEFIQVPNVLTAPLSAVERGIRSAVGAKSK